MTETTESVTNTLILCHTGNPGRSGTDQFSPMTHGTELKHVVSVNSGECDYGSRPIDTRTAARIESTYLRRQRGLSDPSRNEDGHAKVADDLRLGIVFDQSKCGLAAPQQRAESGESLDVGSPTIHTTRTFVVSRPPTDGVSSRHNGVGHTTCCCCATRQRLASPWLISRWTAPVGPSRSGDDNSFFARFPGAILG